MIIGIDARFWGLENAGLGRYTMNLVRELEKIDKKNNYVIFLRDKYFNQLNFRNDFRKVRAEFRHYSLSEQTGLLKVLNKEKLDLAHFLHFNLPLLYKGKFVVTIHDLLMQEYRGVKATTLPLYKYFPKHLAAKLVFKKAIHRSQKIIVPSRSVKKEVQNYFRVEKDKIAVTYEGVAEDFRAISQGVGFEKYKVKKPYLLYVGNAYPHKNLERAIRAVLYLNELSRKKIFFYLGTPRDAFLKKITRLISDLKGEKYVKLLGFIPDSQMPSLYKNSLGFLYPSLSEGFGLQGLEAMKAGTLVISSDTPVFKEIYKNVAISFDPYSINAISDAIKKVLVLAPKERKRIISRGKKLVKNYSWTKMAQETLRVYADSVGLRPG